MTKTTVILILALTCATLHAQSVVVKRTDAENVRGTIGQTPTSVLTNLAVTGTLDPDITGSNYVQVSDYSAGYPRWSNSVNNFEFSYIGDPVISDCFIFQVYDEGPRWNKPDSSVITGTYSVSSGATGTANVVYWYQTNFVSTVSVKGIATP